MVVSVEYSNSLNQITVTGGTEISPATITSILDADNASQGLNRNLLYYSENLDNAVWVKSGTADVDSIDSPLPGINAWMISGISTDSNTLAQTVNGLVSTTRYEPSFFIRQRDTSGTLNFQNSSDATKGQWTIDLSLLSGEWEYITRSHAAVTVVSEFSGHTDNTCGFQFQAASGTLSFDLMCPQLEICYYETINVTGTLNPDATGEYTYQGLYNGQTYYMKSGGGYYIWYFGWDGSHYIWVICPKVGTYAGPLWLKTSTTHPGSIISSSYTVGPGAAGTATTAFDTTTPVNTDYEKSGWGKVINYAEDSYLFNGYLNIGDESTSTYVNMESISFYCQYFRARNNATFSINKNFIKSYTNPNSFTIISSSASSLIISNSFIFLDGTQDYYFLGNYYFNKTLLFSLAATNGKFFRFGSSNQIDYLIIKGMNVNLGTEISGTVIHPAHSVKLLVKSGSPYGVRMLDGDILYNVVFDTSFYMDVSAGNSTNFTLIDATKSPSINSLTTSVSGSSSSITFSFTLNISLKEQTTLIENATVALTDKFGTQIFSTQTDINGNILPQIVRYKTIFSQNSIYYSPHYLSITKTGYEPIVQLITMDKKQDLVLEMKPIRFTEEYRQKLTAISNALPNTTIAKSGQIMELTNDYDPAKIEKITVTEIQEAFKQSVTPGIPQIGSAKEKIETIKTLIEEI